MHPLHTLKNLPKILKPQEGTSLLDRYTLYSHAGTEGIIVPKEGEYDHLTERFAELCEDMGIAKPPRLLITERKAPNAHSLRGSGSVAITSSLLEALDHEQQRSVFAHELEHHRHRLRDTAVDVAFNAGALAAIEGIFKLTQKPLHDAITQKSEWKTTAIVGARVLGSVEMLHLANRLKKPVRHQKEYESDRAAAEYTSPEVAISALEKLQEIHCDYRKTKVGASHPSHADRVAALRHLSSGAQEVGV